ncbi:hypothetical protein ACWF62_14230 [Rhodococcus sp. NPDC054953]
MSDTAFEILVGVRQRLVEAGTLPGGVLKDAQLQQIVRSKRQTVAEVEQMLPRSAKDAAPALAEALTAAAEPAAAAGGRWPGPSSRGDAPAARRDDALIDLGTADFCEYAHEQSDHPVTRVVVAREPGGGHRLSWDRVDVQPGEIALYRVVTGEGMRAYKPEAGQLVGVTQGTHVVDTAPPASAVRYVQVWCHVGSHNRDAARRQPILVAEGQILTSVADFLVVEDEGTVIGQWSAWPGVDRVRVLRIPLDGSVQIDNDPRHRILVDTPNLGGFVDPDARRGMRYLYRAICEIEVDGRTQLSPPAEVEVAVSAVLAPVTDLTVAVADGPSGDTRFGLTWTPPPVGRVVMYRTATPPRPGLSRTALEDSALEVSGGLPASARLVHPIVAGDNGANRMADVSWPRDWVRAYFTPVTVLDGRVQVGSTVTATRPLPALSDVRIHERGFEQVLTFPWPSGAVSVSVHLSAPLIDAGDVLSRRPDLDISRSEYERDGGLYFPQPLPPAGCAVHVVPVTYTAGERIVGTPVTVQYPGLLRIWYDIVAAAPGSVAVRLSSEIDTQHAPPFVLVHNPERLPLSVRDGDPLAVRGSAGAPDTVTRRFQPARLGRQVDESWIADVTNRTGYLRVFVDVEPEVARRVAVVDPPMERIRLDPPTEQPQ